MINSTDDAPILNELAQHVYVIGTTEAKTVKIGIAEDVTQRLGCLQTGSPVDLVILAKSRRRFDNAREIEKLWHDRLSKYRVRREWFELPQAVRTRLIYDIERGLPPCSILAPIENNNAPVSLIESSDLVFTADELCAELKLSRVTLWRLEKRGVITPILGLRGRYARSMVERFLSRKPI